MIGEIYPVSGYLPANCLKCDGSVKLIAEYPDLFAVIGTEYGGDGVTTFGLPDYPPLYDDASFFVIVSQ